MKHVLFVLSVLLAQSSVAAEFGLNALLGKLGQGFVVQNNKTPFAEPRACAVYVGSDRNGDLSASFISIGYLSRSHKGTELKPGEKPIDGGIKFYFGKTTSQAGHFDSTTSSYSTERNVTCEKNVTGKVVMQFSIGYDFAEVQKITVCGKNKITDTAACGKIHIDPNSL